MRFFVLFFVACASESKIITDSAQISSIAEDRDADGDGFIGSEDCDDGDPAVYSGAEEICDGVDNNCDGEVDEGLLSEFYLDADGDGFGISEDSIQECSLLEGYSDQSGDCDDDNDAVYPQAPEQCDGVDNNCDGDIDEDLVLVWYEDADGDGFGNIDLTEENCIQPEGYVDNSEDCDDVDEQIYPQAPEQCDELDNDCDGEIDEDVGSIWYVDNDLDYYGDPNCFVWSCTQPEGYTSMWGDCDDTDSYAYPGAIEYCDYIDNNCDGVIDEGSAVDALIWYLDDDSDGFGDPVQTKNACELPNGYVADNTDCDDTRADSNPNAQEYCDGHDDNCDGVIDEDSALDAQDWYLDNDSDGFGDVSTTIHQCAQPSGYVLDNTDCDDVRLETNPSAPEYCNSIDDNCDGSIDENSALDAQDWFVDGDGDGFGDVGDMLHQCEQPGGYVSDNTDCDDTRADSNPNAQEYCDGHDDNCDGVIDEDSALDAQDWYLDNDSDGFGDVSTTIHQCAQPSGYVLDNTDCDDVRLETNPSAPEYCNSIDDNCNGSIDDGAAVDALMWYQDVDEDGFGDPNISLARCVQPSGYVSDNTDCDDELVTSNPSALEYCNGVDDDCDGTTDEQGAIGMGTYYVDADGDGYGSSSSVNLCSLSSGYSSSNDDCNDGNSGISPGASEVCGNTTDENCNGQYSESCPQTYYGCGGPGALQPGATISCSFGGTRYIDQVRVSGGCNDGESGTYTFSFSDGSSVTVSGGCNSVHSISPRFASSATLYMNSGGGGDNNISWTCCGSSGWGIYYR